MALDSIDFARLARKVVVVVEGIVVGFVSAALPPRR
jgi:hypothetical protein